MKQQVLMIHGGTTFNSSAEFRAALEKKTVTIDDLRPHADWKRSLPEQLGEGFDVLAPSMPNKQNASYEEWRVWFSKIIPLVEDGVVLVGHSLGGLFLAKYLSENNIAKKVKAAVLVAAPFGQDSVELASFSFTTPLTLFSQQIPLIHLFHSSDDPIVPVAATAKYAEALPSAQLHLLNGQRHFNQEKAPEIIDVIKSLA